MPVPYRFHTYVGFCQIFKNKYSVPLLNDWLGDYSFYFRSIFYVYSVLPLQSLLNRTKILNISEQSFVLKPYSYIAELNNVIAILVSCFWINYDVFMINVE